MKNAIVAVLILFVSSSAFAEDERHMTLFSDAMSSEDAKMKLTNDGKVKFFFGAQRTPAVGREIGKWVSNKKTNAFNKPDEEACNWAFLSAMISLKQRALREGGDAVIDIHSYYKKNVIEDKTRFECGAGVFIAGVALRGTVVKLK